MPLATGGGAACGLLASGGLALKYSCSVNIFRSGSQCEKNLGVDLSISVLGTLKAMISYGSAANRRYWYLLSQAWTLCSKDDMNRCLGLALSSISGYSIWNRRERCLVSESNCFVTLYPGLPILTVLRMETFRLWGWGWAGASLASRAALLARLVWWRFPWVWAR